MDFYRLRRVFGHWSVWPTLGICAVVALGFWLRPVEPTGSIPNVGVRQQQGNSIPVVAGPDAGVHHSADLPPFSVPQALTMSIELELTAEEQASFRLVEWLPPTITLILRHDRAQATELISAFNQLRTDTGMPALIADEDLAQRANAMAQSRLSFRLYDEAGAVFRQHQADWLAAFGVIEGGVVSADVLPLAASVIAAGDSQDQLVSILRDGAYGPLSSARYTHIGIGVGRVDGWETGGTLVILFY